MRVSRSDDLRRAIRSAAASCWAEAYQPCRAVSIKKAPLQGLHLFHRVSLCLFVNPCLDFPNCSRVLRWGSPVVTGYPALDGRPALASGKIKCCWPRPDPKPLISEISIQPKFRLFFRCHCNSPKECSCTLYHAAGTKKPAHRILNRQLRAPSWCHRAFGDHALRFSPVPLFFDLGL